MNPVSTGFPLCSRKFVPWIRVILESVILQAQENCSFSVLT